ncbi:hypothetical protein V1515DRAFT_607047 [Lipomyces mesembrius]
MTASSSIIFTAAVPAGSAVLAALFRAILRLVVKPNGGHSDYIQTSADDLVRLPLSYIDGSVIACGLGTAYAATLRAQISGLEVTNRLKEASCELEKLRVNNDEILIQIESQKALLFQGVL